MCCRSPQKPKSKEKKPKTQVIRKFKIPEEAKVNSLFSFKLSLFESNLPFPVCKVMDKTSLLSKSIVKNGKALDLFGCLPTDMILQCLSYLSAENLISISQLDKTFHLLSQTSFLWKKLTLTINPAIIHTNILIVDWKARYQREVQTERNFLAMRKRTCSVIASIMSPIHQRLSRVGTLKGTADDYYFYFNQTGFLRAIFQNKLPKEVYNVDGKLETLRSEDWNVRAVIHTQFIQVAILDGQHLFTPEIKLEPIFSLNQAQINAVGALNQKIKEWFSRTIAAVDLDEQVRRLLKNHYKTQTAIKGMRGGDRHLTVDYKAYFIFFRALLENPLNLQFSSSPYDK